ncbi:MAG: gamma carbonic anhydrase family protein [Rhodospirillales bacterium]
MSGLILPYNDILPKIADDAFIAQNAVIIGDVEIGPEANIWYNVVVRGDVASIRIGARANIQDGTIVHVSRGRAGTVIGDDVTIGHMAIIHACTLESHAFVGMGATVMDGAVVEGGGMVAAGALLTPNKRVKKGELWSGSPAKYWRQLTDEENHTLPQTAAHYAKMAQHYRKVAEGK